MVKGLFLLLTIPALCPAAERIEQLELAIAVEHQCRRHAGTWPLAGLHPVGHGLAVGTRRIERKVGQLVVQQEAADHQPCAEGVLHRGGHGQGVAGGVEIVPRPAENTVRYGRPGQGRGQQQVADREGVLEVLRDQRAHLRCLGEIGVVEACRQHIGADQDAALHFRAEAFAAAALVQVGDVVVVHADAAVRDEATDRVRAVRLDRRRRGEQHSATRSRFDRIALTCVAPAAQLLTVQARPTCKSPSPPGTSILFASANQLLSGF